MRRIRLPTLVLVGALILAACGAPYAPLADARAPEFDVASLPPISLPADHAPHANLTEWWYFTGHLMTDDARRYGFELAFFQSVRGDASPGYGAHLALTDVDGREFRYDQRISTDRGARSAHGLDLCVGGWALRAVPGGFELEGQSDSFGIDLTIRPDKPAVMHNRSGVLDFSPYGWSYYYSFTRSSVSGNLRDGERRLAVTGEAWMDHQWGDFISVSDAGWDWFSVQLDDGRDFTASLVRGSDGLLAFEYGTLVEPDGRARHIVADELEIEALGTWTSPATGAAYPSGWHVRVPDAGLDLTLDPVLADQELDTRASVGLVYWEGAVDVRAAGRVVGRGYVELTGHGPTGFSVFEAVAPGPADPCLRP